MKTREILGTIIVIVIILSIIGFLFYPFIIHYGKAFWLVVLIITIYTITGSLANWLLNGNK